MLVMHPHFHMECIILAIAGQVAQALNMNYNHDAGAAGQTFM